MTNAKIQKLELKKILKLKLIITIVNSNITKAMPSLACLGAVQSIKRQRYNP